MRYASNAVLAKARAMYAGHIDSSEYKELAGVKTLQDFISRLRRKKRYALSLDKATPDITAAQTEELLRMSVFEQLSILSRYEISGRQDFYRFYIVKRDIEQILRCLRLLISGRPQEFLADLPAFFNKLTDLDLIGLSSARSIEDIIKVLSGTPYRKILEPFVPVYTEFGSYLRIEAAFNEYLYSFLEKTVARDKADKKQISEVLSLYLDADFIVYMYRLKKMKVGDEKVFDSYISRKYTYFTEKQIKELYSAANEKEFIAVLERTSYAEAVKGLDFGNTEQVIEDYVCGKYIKGLRFYTDPSAIMICYMYLAENEVMNLIRIAEGIKYRVSPDKILAVLTGIGG